MNNVVCIYDFSAVNGVLKMIALADLHLHTIYSDGLSTPLEVIKHALMKKIDVIAITDHNTFQGALKAKEIVKEKGLMKPYILIGNEVRTSKGDVIVICADPLDKLERKKGINLYVTYDIAKENDCLIFPAHPYDLLKFGVGKYVYLLKWDAVEIFNSMSDPICNSRSLKLLKKLPISGLSNSDAHLASFIGLSYNIILVNELSYDYLISSIRRRLVRNICRYPSVPQNILRFTTSTRRFISKVVK